MPDLSAQLTNLRTSGHSLQGYLSVYKGAVAATFTVSVGYLDSDYPLSAITGTYTTGSASDVGEGFLCEIRTSGGELRGITRTRYGATQTATSLKIRELSRGEIVVANGDVITIRREVRLSDLLVAADETFAPDLITYSDQGSAVIPMPNSGGGWAGFVDTGQTFASVSFFGNLSYALDPDSGGTLTHVWTIPSGGGSFQSGSNSTSTNPVIEFNVGCWLLKHVVTDSSNSKSTTQYIPVCVHNTTTNPPVPIITRSLSGTPQDGWSYSCNVFDDADLTAIPDGSLVFFWTQERIAGTTQSFGSPVTGRSHMKAVGYLRRETERSEAGLSELSFDIISPLARLGELAGFSKVMQRIASPDAWGEIVAMTTFLAIVFNWLYYSNASYAGFDFIKHASYTSLDYPLLFLNKDNPLAQNRELARATDARIVCDRTGRFELQPVLHLLDRTTRNSLTTTLTLIRSDWFDIEVSREHWRPVETVYVKGFTAHATDPTPLFAKWPGNAPGHGSATDSIEKLIYLQATGIYARAGLHGAYKDGWFVDSNLVGHYAPRIRLTLPGAYNVFDFYAEWVQLNITTTLRQIDLTDFRYTLESVTVNYQDGTATTEIELQAETFGESGVDDTPTVSNTSQLTDPSDIWQGMGFDPYTGADLLGTTANIALLRGDSVSGISGLVYTSIFTSTVVWSQERWEAVTGSPILLDAAEYIVDGVQKPGTARTLFTVTNTKARIFTSILNGTTVGLTYALRATSALRIVQAERSDPNVCYILTSYSDGIWSEGHINGVAITANLIGDGTYQSSFRPALFVDPTNSLIAYTITRNGSGKIRLFKTTNGGVSWTENADYQWNTVATSSGCSKPADNVTHGIFISRSFKDPSVMYIGGKDSANSWPIYRCTSSTNVIISFLDSGTCASFTGWAGPTNRRGFRTFDADANLLVSQFFLQSTSKWALYKSTDRGDNWTAIRSTGVASTEPSLYLGGDGSVYECINNTIRFHPNIYNLTDDSQFTDKTGTGYPATIAPHVLFGL